MSRLPAWKVDPAWPAVPPSEEDDWNCEPGHDELGSPHSDPRQVDLIEQERSALTERVAMLHTQGLNLQLKLHHAQRQLQAQPAAPAPPAAPHARRGHPGHRARNDRLLAHFDNTPAHLPHLHRCRVAAQRLAAEIAASAGLPPERARVMPATTARSAIAEAQARREAR
jgi:hypothetical protein